MLRNQLTFCANLKTIRRNALCFPCSGVTTKINSNYNIRVHYQSNFSKNNNLKKNACGETFFKICIRTKFFWLRHCSHVFVFISRYCFFHIIFIIQRPKKIYENIKPRHHLNVISHAKAKHSLTVKRTWLSWRAYVWKSRLLFPTIFHNLDLIINFFRR